MTIIVEGNKKGLVPAVVRSKEAAKYIGVSEGGLRNMRAKGTAPRSISYGNRDVRYRVIDLDRWLAIKAGDTPPDEPKRTPKKRGPKPKNKPPVLPGI